MAYGSARTQGSGGEQIHHFSHFRLRVTGSGNLQFSVYSLDNIKTKTLANLAMSPTNSREPTKLVNFVTQRMALKFGTSVINEYFRINRIIIYARPIATEYPH